MNAEQNATIQALLVGYWPQPAMTPEEQAIWDRTLEHLDFGTVTQTLEQIATSGQHFRPVVGEMVNQYRLQRSRATGAPQLTSGERYCSRERNLDWLRHCRHVTSANADIRPEECETCEEGSSNLLPQPSPGADMARRALDHLLNKGQGAGSTV